MTQKVSQSKLILAHLKAGKTYARYAMSEVRHA